MKETTKVTLLSALVFPGIGHLVLKKYLIALAFIVSFSYLLLGFITEIVEKAQHVIDSVVRGDIPMELIAIRQALIDQGTLDSPNLSTNVFLLLLIWIIATFDAYRLAKKDQMKNR